VTEQTRTVAAERDLPRVKQWLTRLVAGAVQEHAEALAAVRRYCDHLDQAVVICRERNAGTACRECEEGGRVSREFRRLLPAVPETSTSGDTDEEVSHDRDARDVPRRRGRPGLEVDPSP
jgi:hypothetical protein